MTGIVTGDPLVDNQVPPSAPGVAGNTGGPYGGSGGGSGGAVDSVAGKTGTVTLGPTDVGAQPVDTDLTAIAALSTTSYGRALLATSNVAALLTAAGLDTAATHPATDFDATGAAAAAQAADQPIDSDLTAIAALATTTYGRSLLTASTAAAARTALGEVIGTDVEAHDTDLTAISALTPADNDFMQRKAGAWANRTVTQVQADILATVADNVFTMQASADATKQLVLSLAGISTGTKRTITVPNASGTLALLDGVTGGQALIGGTAGGDALTLRGSSSGAHGGTVALNSATLLFAADDANVTSAIFANLFGIRNAYTLNFAAASFGTTLAGVIDVSPTLVAQQSMTAGGFAPIFVHATTSNAPGVAANLAGGSSYQARNTWTADTQSVSISAMTDYFSRWTFKAINAGTLTASNDYVNFESALTLDATGGTISFTGTYAAFGAIAPTLTNSPTFQNYTTFRAPATAAGSVTSYGLDVGAITGAGTNIGVRIAAPSGGTTNLGIQNKGATALGSTGQLTVDGSGNLSTSGTLVGTIPINLQSGTTYTLVIGDQGGLVRMANASANTLTIPANASVAFPIGTVIYFVNTLAGTMTLAITTDTLTGTTSYTTGTGGFIIKRAATTWTAFKTA